MKRSSSERILLMSSAVHTTCTVWALRATGAAQRLGMLMGLRLCRMAASRNSASTCCVGNYDAEKPRKLRRAECPAKVVLMHSALTLVAAHDSKEKIWLTAKTICSMLACTGGRSQSLMQVCVVRIYIAGDTKKRRHRRLNNATAKSPT